MESRELLNRLLPAILIFSLPFLLLSFADFGLLPRTGSIVLVIGMGVFSTLLAFIILAAPRPALERAAEITVKRLPDLTFHLFFTCMLVADLTLLVLFLLFPSAIYQAEGELLFSVQVLGCMATAGLLGGFMKLTLTTLRPVELGDHGTQGSAYVRFWSTLFSLFASLVAAMVLFFLLRAGILKTVEVDTFNVYGVTGVSVITGYFADNLAARLTQLYRQLFDGGSHGGP